MEENGVKVDHSTLNRRVTTYSSSLALAAYDLKVFILRISLKNFQNQHGNIVLEALTSAPGANAFVKQASDLANI